MSRNFELLEQIEIELANGPGNNGAQTRASKPEEHRRVSPGSGAHPVDRDLVNLVQSVFTPRSGRTFRRVAFCGIDKVNSSSSVCAQVASALAATTSEKVCMVHANPGSTGSAGTALSGQNIDGTGAGEGHHEYVPVADHLWLATLPTAGPAHLHTIDELRSRLERLQGEFSYVLIDASPSDAGVFGQISDGVILVIEADSTRRDHAAKAKLSLETAGVRLLGTVLHNRSYPIPRALYERL
jgi:hypothetical protein